MLSIIPHTYDEKIVSATNHINKLCANPMFLGQIAAHSSFDLSDTTPKTISQMFVDTELELTVSLYQPNYPYQYAYSYDNISSPNTIHMNQLTINRPVHSLCNTIMHQCVHALDAASPNYSFGHGDHTCTGKENTAPFWIASLAQKFVAKNYAITELMPHQKTFKVNDETEDISDNIQEQLIEAGIFCIYDHMSILGTDA